MQELNKISDLIVNQNNQFIVATKFAGMPCVPDRSGDPNLKNILESYAKHDLHIITRTDRPVSGLALFAKSQNSAKNLSAQIQDNKVTKSYLAIVEKKPEHEEGILTDYLIKAKNNKSIIVDASYKGSKKAVLKYRTILSLDNYTVLRIELETGRFHQIRSQLAGMGCPVKGDVKYGARRKNPDRSIHLHAYELSFNHPVTKERLTFASQPNKEDSLWKLVVDSLMK